ncbi:hypothetical protein OIU76_013315 [Salix suchowensis]|nr:hypothetical protein OIU76_013315 [Salix suchowensis]
MQEVEAGVVKWLGSVGGIVDAPMDRLEKKVFQECAVSDSCSLNKMVTDRIKERLVSMDSTSYNYVYRMEASNIDPLEGNSEDSIIDYLGFLYKSSINRIEDALKA